MALLRTLLFTLVFYSGSVFAVLGAFPVSLLGRRILCRYAVGWAYFHRLCATYILGIRTRIEGVIPDGVFLFACKHQSMYETLELLLILDRPGVVFKRELASIPFWGKVALLYGAIPVDREGSARALREMIQIAKIIAGEGRSIAIFPEGTRVPPGEAPPLRAGFAGLYRLIGMPVVPIALDAGRLWKRRSFVKHSGVITFRFGEIIPAGLPRKEAEARVYQAINVLN